MLAGVDRELLDELLDTLDGRARYTVEARFGLLDGSPRLPGGRRGPGCHRRGRPPARQAGRGRPTRQHHADPGRLVPPGQRVPLTRRSDPAAAALPPELRRPFRHLPNSRARGSPDTLEGTVRETTRRSGRSVTTSDDVMVRPDGQEPAVCARPRSGGASGRARWCDGTSVVPVVVAGLPHQAQQPVWPDESDLDHAVKQIGTYPPLVFAGEARALQASLARVAAGNAFLLQAGDSAESFDDFRPSASARSSKSSCRWRSCSPTRSGVPVVKVGRSTPSSSPSPARRPPSSWTGPSSPASVAAYRTPRLRPRPRACPTRNDSCRPTTSRRRP